MSRRDVFICDAVRTPFGKFMGAFKDMPSARLGATVVRALYERQCIHPRNIDGVFMGEVLTAGEGQNPARHAALGAGLPNSCQTETFNKVCASSLSAMRHATHMIQVGEAQCMIAGGMENMSRAPYLMRRGRRHAGSAPLADMQVSGVLDPAQPAEDSMIHDGLTEPSDAARRHMGAFADECARTYKISRMDQEAFAYTSATRAAEHRKQGQVVLCSALVSDECLRAPNAEATKALKPAFTSEGTVTAATSSQIADGASAVLLANVTAVNSLELTPLALVRRFKAFSHRPEWFTTAPTYAIQTLLRELHMRVDDVDLFEINEAFAVVPLHAMETLNIPREKVNIWGGAIALGHPLGASGTRIAGSLAWQLKVLNKRRGIAVACNGGGEAVAVMLERP